MLMDVCLGLEIIRNNCVGGWLDEFEKVGNSQGQVIEEENTENKS